MPGSPLECVETTAGSAMVGLLWRQAAGKFGGGDGGFRGPNFK